MSTASFLTLEQMTGICSPQDALDDSPQGIGFHYAYHHAVRILTCCKDKEYKLHLLCRRLREIYLLSEEPFAWQNLQNSQWVLYFDKGVAMLNDPNCWSKSHREKYNLPIPIIPDRGIDGRSFWRLDVMKYEAAQDAEKVCNRLFDQFASMELCND